MMATEKIWRAFRVIETKRRQGKAVPKYAKYEVKMPDHGFKEFVKTEVNMFTHIFCFLPNKFRAPVLKFFLGKGGYGLLWLNNQRRSLRHAMRDFFAKLRRERRGEG